MFCCKMKLLYSQVCCAGNSNSNGATPVHLIITKIKWIRTRGLSIKNSLSVLRWGRPEFGAGADIKTHTYTISLSHTHTHTHCLSLSLSLARSLSDQSSVPGRTDAGFRLGCAAYRTFRVQDSGFIVQVLGFGR